MNRKLTELLDKLEYEQVCGKTEREITAVVYDSRKVIPGCLFICINGANFDGHDFAAQVAAQGAGVLVVQKDIELPADADVTVIKVADTRYAMAFISAAWFGHPAEKLKVIGITGTKGKTTTTYLVKSILENAGYKVGLVGTIEVIIGDEHIHANNTTPESYLLQEYFARMVDAGLDTVVMEVSSQALMLHRTQGFVFDYGIFTNLEPDHIGPNEHASFEEYLHCKGLLFKQCKVGIVDGGTYLCTGELRHGRALHAAGREPAAGAQTRRTGSDLPCDRSDEFCCGSTHARQIQCVQCAGSHCHLPSF